MAQIGKGVKITWYGHATFLYEVDGKRIMVDPWVYNNPACPDNLKRLDRLDAMLITHGHFDNMGDAVQVAKDVKPSTVIGIFEMYLWLEKQGVEGGLGMNIGGTHDLGGVKVTMLKADHSGGTVDDDGNLLYLGTAVGYLLEMENGFKIYHTGDTGIFGDMRLYGELYRPDLAVLPIGDLYTMDPRQAAYACEMLGVKRAIPCHHSTWPVLTGTPQALREELSKRGYQCEVIELQPGESVE